MAEREYQRLTWTRRRSGFAVAAVGRASLWLGKDHLLSVESTGFMEKYKRFYFRDIQVFTIRKTTWREVWNFIWALLLVISLALAISVSSMPWKLVFGSLATLFLLGLTLNTAAGPTCICHVRTAVQVEELASLRRVRSAQKILARIRPLIAALQGELTPEDISVRMQELNVPSPNTAEGAPASPARPASESMNPPPSTLL